MFRHRCGSIRKIFSIDCLSSCVNTMKNKFITKWSGFPFSRQYIITFTRAHKTPKPLVWPVENVGNVMPDISANITINRHIFGKFTWFVIARRLYRAQLLVCAVSMSTELRSDAMPSRHINLSRTIIAHKYWGHRDRIALTLTYHVMNDEQRPAKSHTFRGMWFFFSKQKSKKKVEKGISYSTLWSWFCKVFAFYL